MPLKIFIGNNPLYLCKNGFVLPPIQAIELTSKSLIQENFINQNQLVSILEKMENKKNDVACMIFYSDVSDLINEFNSIFKLIDAAGGLVENMNDEILMIYRKKKWDLPKGKVELNEVKIDAAEREVKEETGIKNLKVENQLLFYPWQQPYTSHCYWENNHRILKNTYWYKMKSINKSEFTPQTAEGITDVKWIKKKQTKELLKNSYASITDVLRCSQFEI